MSAFKSEIATLYKEFNYECSEICDVISIVTLYIVYISILISFVTTPSFPLLSMRCIYANKSKGKKGGNVTFID